MEGKALNDRNIELLISLWHDEPSLWDSSLSEYRNGQCRRAALERISALMGNLDTDVIEAKLRSLRTEFGYYLRVLKMPSEATSKRPRKSWRFFDQLLFLKDHIVPRGNTKSLYVHRTENGKHASGAEDFIEHLGNGTGEDSAACHLFTSDYLASMNNFSTTANSFETSNFSTPGATGSPQVTPVGSPATKRRKRSDAAEPPPSPASYLETANALMSVVCKCLMEPKPTEQQNSARFFCDMLYYQLMGIPNEDDREMLQYRIHSTVMQYKTTARRHHPSVPVTARPPASRSDALNPDSFTSLSAPVKTEEPFQFECCSAPVASAISPSPSNDDSSSEASDLLSRAYAAYPRASSTAK